MFEVLQDVGLLALIGAGAFAFMAALGGIAIGVSNLLDRLLHKG